MMTPRIQREIQREIERAQAKHGHFVEKAVRGYAFSSVLAVLVEEVGEVAEEVNDLALTSSIDEATAIVTKLRAELVQVAATAARWIAAIDAVRDETDVRDGVGRHVDAPTLTDEQIHQLFVSADDPVIRRDCHIALGHALNLKSTRGMTPETLTRDAARARLAQYVTGVGQHVKEGT